MTKGNKIKLIIGLIAIGLLSCGFYWVQIRPVLLKKQCSWYTYVQPAKEATQGITQEEADRMNKENKNTNPIACTKTSSSSLDDLFLDCKPTNIKSEPPRPA